MPWLHRAVPAAPRGLARSSTHTHLHSRETERPGYALSHTIEKAKSPPARAPDTRRHPRDQSATETPSGSAPCLILVVEDDPHIRNGLALLLKRSGFGVATASNGKEALDYLMANAPPSAILLDLSMPVMDGGEFRRQQLADPVIRHIPVIVTSAAADVETEPKVTGAVAVIPKPYRIELLVGLLGRVVDRHGRRVGVSR